MPSIQITLKYSRDLRWKLFSPTGYQIGPEFRGDEYKAISWAKSFISTWPNWVLHIEGENCEKKDRFPD